MTAGSTALVADNKAAEDYVIGSGDQLSIFVYRNPDLSEAGEKARQP